MTCILGQWERDLSDPFLRLVWPRAEKVSFVHSRLARLATLGGSATFRENSGGYLCQTILGYFDIFLLLSNERCTAIIGLPYLTSFRSITYATLLPTTYSKRNLWHIPPRSLCIHHVLHSCTLRRRCRQTRRHCGKWPLASQPAGSSSLAPISQKSFSTLPLCTSQNQSCSFRAQF